MTWLHLDGTTCAAGHDEAMRCSEGGGVVHEPFPPCPLRLDLDALPRTDAVEWAARAIHRHYCLRPWFDSCASQMTQHRKDAEAALGAVLCPACRRSLLEDADGASWAYCPRCGWSDSMTDLTPTKQGEHHP